MEISLYDTDGRPTMYVAEDGESIYSWDGYAVCYLADEEIYSWRGDHRGWLLDGIVYDLDGYRVGYVREASPHILFAESTKWTKKTKWTKSIRGKAKTRPTLKGFDSRKNLAEYLSHDHP